MDGNEVYKINYKNKISNILKSNPDKKYLSGFYHFIPVSVSSAYSYLNYVLGFMNECQKEVTDLELDDFTQYLSIIDDKTSSYQIAIYSALKLFSEYLHASGKIQINYMQFVKRPKFTESIQTKTKRENGYLEENEIKQYLQSVKDGVGTYRALARQENWKERDLAIVMLFLNTGMRCSGLFKLNLENVNIEKKSIITVEKGGKNQEHRLSEDVFDILSDWIDKRESILEGVREDALFVSNQKRRMDQSSIARVIKKYNEIDGKNITPHKLRATYATQLYKATGDIYMVQECMEHSSPSVTELYIRGQKNKSREKAADIMRAVTVW